MTISDNCLRVGAFAVDLIIRTHDPWEHWVTSNVLPSVPKLVKPFYDFLFGLMGGERQYWYPSQISISIVQTYLVNSLVLNSE